MWKQLACFLCVFLTFAIWNQEKISFLLPATPAEVCTTFAQTSATAVSCRRRLTPGGCSAARADEIMRNSEVLHREVGAYRRGELVGTCRALLVVMCSSVQLVSGPGIRFALSSVLFTCFLFSLHLLCMTPCLMP